MTEEITTPIQDNSVLEIEQDGEIKVKPGFFTLITCKRVIKVLAVVVGLSTAGVSGSAISEYVSAPGNIQELRAKNAEEHTAIKSDLTRLEQRLNAIDDKLESVRRIQCYMLLQTGNVPPEVMRSCL
jgi:hypothetical protein